LSFASHTFLHLHPALQIHSVFKCGAASDSDDIERISFFREPQQKMKQHQLCSP